MAWNGREGRAKEKKTEERKTGKWRGRESNTHTGHGHEVTAQVAMASHRDGERERHPSTLLPGLFPGWPPHSVRHARSSITSTEY